MIDLLRFLFSRIRVYYCTSTFLVPTIYVILTREHYDKERLKYVGRSICSRYSTVSTSSCSKWSSGKQGCLYSPSSFVFAGNWNRTMNEQKWSVPFCSPASFIQKLSEKVQFCVLYQLAASNIPENRQHKTSINA